MRTLILILAAICLIVGPAAVPAAGPSTKPVAPSPVPSANSPAPSVPAPSAPPPIVLIYPFQPIGQVKGQEWVSSALLEYMVSDVNKSGIVQARAMATPIPASDSAKALAAGKDAGAATVIFGSYQIVGDQIRVTGQMTQVSSGNVISSLQSTGTVTDIFRVEDRLAGQFNPALARNVAPSQPPRLVLFGVPTDMYAESNTIVRPLPSGQIQPEFFSGPSSGYDSNYPYIYAPGTVFSSGIFLGNRLDYGYYDSYNRGNGHGGRYEGFRIGNPYGGGGYYGGGGHHRR